MTRRSAAERESSVFLNVPFDRGYEALMIALVAGVTALGCVPHCVLEVRGGTGRLSRIFDLMRSCSISIHDLSRVEVGRAGGFLVPRFNMAFELGLAAAIHFSEQHQLILFEERRHRLQVSLSDMNGYDPEIHEGTQDGVLRATLNSLGTSTGLVTLREMKSVTRRLSGSVADAKRRNRSRTIFEPHMFRLTVAAATRHAQQARLIR